MWMRVVSECCWEEAGDGAGRPTRARPATARKGDLKVCTSRGLAGKRVKQQTPRSRRRGSVPGLLGRCRLTEGLSAVERARDEVAWSGEARAKMVRSAARLRSMRPGRRYRKSGLMVLDQARVPGFCAGARSRSMRASSLLRPSDEARVTSECG